MDLTCQPCLSLSHGDLVLNVLPQLESKIQQTGGDDLRTLSTSSTNTAGPESAGLLKVWIALDCFLVSRPRGLPIRPLRAVPHPDGATDC